MKNWIYGICLALLPLSYVGLMLATRQPIEWEVLALIALIVVPVIVFRKRIGVVEQQFDAMPEQEKRKAVAKTAEKLAGKAAGEASARD